MGREQREVLAVAAHFTLCRAGGEKTEEILRAGKVDRFGVGMEGPGHVVGVVCMAG